MANFDNVDDALQDLRARITALEASEADHPNMLDAIKAFGNTQQLLADVMREFAIAMRSTAEDTNQRVRSLDASTAEIKALLAARSAASQP